MNSAKPKPADPNHGEETRQSEAKARMLHDIVDVDIGARDVRSLGGREVKQSQKACSPQPSQR